MKLKGTENQIKFAEKIIEDMEKVIKTASQKRIEKEYEKFNNFDISKKQQYGTKEEYIQIRKNMMKEAEEKIFLSDEANYYINQFKDILQEKSLTEKAKIIRANDGKSGIGVTLRYLFL